MAYTITSQVAGLLPIANTDAGQTTANSATAVPTFPAKLGMIVTANDPTYGDGEFICLLGVANTVVGSMVTYNATTYQTALSPDTAGIGSSFAFAMSANGAGTFGWYQIGGLAVAKKTAVKVTPQVAMYQSGTTGRVMATVASGKQIVGCRSANLTTVTATTSTVVLQINRPHNTGVII